MGWNFTIGEAEIFYEQEDYGYVTIKAKGVRLDEAPAFGEPTDYTSERWPSYTGWAEVVEHANMNYLFDKNIEGSLITTHPGAAAITNYHREEIEKVFASFKARYPNSTPTYESGVDEDATLCRLEWLKFWINWAVDNCSRPIFKNS